ncbi:hypothetical protein [Thermomonospora cellulosilytica]|uniref:Uncharacterized protein n=1 Tax=Thermomonospora cellulosilytica TaxID=1411118 RepID=A0A7W3R6D5_9ACTN|nr:hypothetical protein [Thermomonospora cellulosilytica]MBA9002023.1 hypothetical protein [Thermomonospora cellulosilytica]
MTVDEALGNAARLLHEAELERGNLPLMERLESIADTWVSIAQLITERDRV